MLKSPRKFIVAAVKDGEVEKRRLRFRQHTRIFVFILAVLGLAYSVFKITEEYLHDDNIVTVTKVSADVVVVYPGITICANGPYKCSAFVKSPEMSHLVPNATCTDYMDSKIPLIWRMDHIANYKIAYKKMKTDDDFWTKMPKYENVHRYIYSTMNSSELANYTLSYKEFIHHCRFRFRHCDESYFLRTFDHEFGQCYTFNSAWRSTNDGKLKYIPKPYTSLWSGAASSLILQFKINRSEVIPPLSFGVGIHVVVHDRHHRPVRLNRQFIDVEPGKFTTIGIQKKIVEKIDRSVCRSDYNEDMKRMFKKSIAVNEKYDSVKCINFMLQKTRVQDCNCRSAIFIGYEDFPNLKDCADLGRKIFSCTSRVLKQEIVQKFCAHPCKSEHYDLSVTSKLIPIPRHLLDDRDFNITDETEEIHKYSTGWLNIFYETPETTHFKEHKRFTFLSMIGNYGGYVGLYVGISVLSLLDLLDYAWHKFHDRNKTDKIAATEKQKEFEMSEAFQVES